MLGEDEKDELRKLIREVVGEIDREKRKRELGLDEDRREKDADRKRIRERFGILESTPFGYGG